MLDLMLMSSLAFMLLLSCVPAVVLADVFNCGSGMTVDIGDANPTTGMHDYYNHQVLNIPWGHDWMNSCNNCGDNLQNDGDICSGWYCQQQFSGVWLKRDGASRPCPDPKPPQECTDFSVSGSWINGGFSSVPWSDELTIGCTFTNSLENSTSWTASASKSMTTGFKTPLVSGSATVTGSLSATFAASYSSQLSARITDTKTWNFPAGQVWHWEFKITDSCGSSTVRNTDVVVTDSIPLKPCCLPGYFSNPSDPRSSCVGLGQLIKLC